MYGQGLKPSPLLMAKLNLPHEDRSWTTSKLRQPMKNRVQEAQVLSSVPPIDSLPPGRLWRRTPGEQTIFIRYVPVINHINYTIPSSSNTANNSPGARFQEDNAPVHNAKIIRHFFQNYKIPVNNHTPYSPNLNSIEYV